MFPQPVMPSFFLFIIPCITTGVLVYIFYTDFMQMRIRNADVLLLLIIFVAGTVVGPFAINALDVFYAASIFVFCYIFWRLGYIGGGDVKLAPLAGLIVGARSGLLFAGILLLLSLVLLYFVYLAQKKEGRLWGQLRHYALIGKVPYGCVLAAASAICIWQAWMMS